MTDETHIDDVSALLARAVAPGDLKADGYLTQPRSWGVYRVEPSGHRGVRRFRMGNHPVRMKELESEFEKVERIALFTSRDLAVRLARQLNGGVS